MNILMICPQFWPIVGGYERASERLAAALADRGLGVTVLTERRLKSLGAHQHRSGFSIRRLRCIYRRGLHGPSSALAYAFWLMRRGRRYDVWHVQQYGLPLTVAVLCGLVMRRPVVVTLTSSAQYGISAALSAGRLRRLNRWAHRRVAGCVALSRETVGEAVAFGIPAERVVLIGNGIDTGIFAPAAPAERMELRQQLGLAQRSTAVFLGRLAPEKNIDGLLRAWALARPRLKAPWTLAIVGDGPLRGALGAQVAALGLGDSVVFAGMTEHSEDWLRAADMNLLSSHTEGLSNTMLEAMACGLPSVVTAVSGMAELIGETGAGVIVPLGDGAAFADAVVKLAGDPELRATMAQAARATILDRYSLDAVTEDHLALYRALAAA